ncbi:MAG: hypothetical protein PHH59_04455 [Methylovulum sp.]|uniref:hypothetical protein n=1 Tax=Methylovulum sp. TaxID=1916980 RepID=UPI00260D9F96|nr:hypothetical protein [Methylovulum sp.]MDD2723261.1 hypothetical protein [Methylovulum sp.]MDD5123418.1 hypothetical protein [Methylovulum sp.]
MLFLAKAGGIAILVWFYMTAKKHGQSPIKWVVIGLMGYWIAWWAVKLTVLAPIVGMFSKNFTMVFIVTQIPALCAIAAAYFVRKKLLADLPSNDEQN